ncbi:MAG: NADH-quinone oxidoreductase subunit C [Eubacteriales bacterium]|nr:NADH-quinone oxidoreductase subunit C [Eubacteriales bacterium]
MNTEETILALNQHFPALEAVSNHPLRIFTVFTTPAAFEEALHFANLTLGYHKGKHIIGTDEGADIGISYILSNDEDVLLVLRERVPKSAPNVRSMGELYPSLVLHERELVDLFGVQVSGLPEGPRYPLPDCWPEGEYPLRKEWNPAYFNKQTVTYEPPKEEDAK